jgi:hypothetical protein
MMLQQLAGTTNASETGRKTVPSSAPTGSRVTNTADVGGGARLQYSHRPPFHHRQVHKQQFLIDTGSGLCVFPSKLIPQSRERVNYDLCTANGTTIRTYGWLPFSLNLGLSREFTRRFVLADVTQPLIGADFLSHFGLLVDCKKQPPAGRSHFVVCLCPSCEFADSQRESHQWRFFRRHSSL